MTDEAMRRWNLDRRGRPPQAGRHGFWSDRLVFLGQFVRRPFEVASIVPSTRFVVRRVAGCVRGCAGTIVELGPGTGGITRAILGSISSVPGASMLVTVELNPALAERVRRIDDPRLVVHRGSAEDLPEILRRYGCAPASAIVSGLPFSTIPRMRAEGILRAIERSLAPDGEFVAYHARDTLERLVGAHPRGARLELVDKSMEWLSIPPLRIYRWRNASRGPARGTATVQP